VLCGAGVLFSCSGPDPYAPDRDSVSQAKAPAVAISDRSDVNQSCCFQSAEDFTSFAPATCGNFRLQPGESVQLKCLTDTMEHSSATFTYANEEGHIVIVTISDYCASSEILTGDYALKFGSFKGPERRGEFNEFDVPASHHGFSSFDAQTRTAVLIVNTGNRFLVEITDQVCENTKNVLTVYEALPLKELSAFGK